MKALTRQLMTLLLALGASAFEPASQPATRPARTVRVAVIGGMNQTGFWDALAKRFEQQTGIRVETVASGPKDGIAQVFRQGGVDLITMHASDTIINLVADGYATDPQPWARSDLVIVGPADDAAGVKGTPDAREALRKIAQRKSPFVVHSSLGAQEVLRDLLDSIDLSLDPAQVTVLFQDRHREALRVASERGAYTLVGRIPFHSARMPGGGKLVVMVAGDPRLRRPYIVALADPARVAGAHVEEARRLAEFLRSDDAQAWIATFGVGTYDDRPLFYPLRDRP